jgi:AraC-like DNA-binding protein
VALHPAPSGALALSCTSREPCTTNHGLRSPIKSAWCSFVRPPCRARNSWRLTSPVDAGTCSTSATHSAPVTRLPPSYAIVAWKIPSTTAMSWVREPGETVCSTFVAKPAEFKMLFVAPSLVDDAAGELGSPERLHFAPRTIREDPRLFAQLHRLCTSIEAARDALEQQSLFAATMVALARHTERKTELPLPGNRKRAVERAKAYLRERFNEPVSLAELASACGMSRFHLVHTFTKQTGLSPHAYQVHVRIERARSLLQKGTSPAAAAASLGFADQSHFTRHFKRIMHVTPAQYASTKWVNM